MNEEIEWEKDFELSNKFVGSRVLLRCGGVVTIRCCKETPFRYLYWYEVNFKDLDSLPFISYYSDGRMYSERESPFDIVAIEKHQFDWSTVKVGDTFVNKSDRNKNLLFFVAHHPVDNSIVILSLSKNPISSNQLTIRNKNGLTLVN